MILSDPTQCDVKKKCYVMLYQERPTSGKPISREKLEKGHMKGCDPTQCDVKRFKIWNRWF